MLRLPRTLQQIHVFEKDSVWYVVNLQTGELIQIDEVIADILELCGTDNNASVLEKLGNRHSEAQIRKALISLSDDLGDLLFEPNKESTLSPTAAEEKLRIFIPHGFMKYKEILSPATNFGIYNLLITLAKYAEVFVEINTAAIDVEQQEQLRTLGVQVVSDIFESTNRSNYSSNRFVINDCDGILALSPHPYEELNYFRHNPIPIVSRVYSDKSLYEATINKVLSHRTLQRDFDQLCFDTPWILPELVLLESFHLEEERTISNGVDAQVYAPQDRQQAREAMASIIGEKSISDLPLVGILNGFQPQNSIRMIEELANLHKDIAFIVLDPILGRYRFQQVHNVFYINLKQSEDLVALPWIYSACELFIFPTVIGTPFSMVLETLACGVPMIALNSGGLPEELTACTISVPLARDDTTGKFIIPTAVISEQINSLRNNRELQKTLSTNARQIALNHSWDKTAQHIVALFTELNTKSTEDTAPKYPDMVFAPYYEKAQSVMRTGAMQLDGFFKHGVEEGLAQTLLSDHTPAEVRTVLQYLLRDDEKVDRLIGTLLP